MDEIADPAIARHSVRFFKTGKGEYGEGDRFLGIRVPVLRAMARANWTISLTEVRKLLASPYHEVRHCALFLLVEQYQRGSQPAKNAVYTTYMRDLRYVNNWDLVDSSAYRIVGPHLETRSRKPLDRLVASPNLWRRRVAVIATLHFIKQGDFAEILRFAERLLDDEQDLIHKAVGWMLREMGRVDRKTLTAFLQTNAPTMPRTMLRYAIERYPEPMRKRFLALPSSRAARQA
ncbi:MAG: DNA alkylation repair protein [Pseudomonadota bacterium]